MKQSCFYFILLSFCIVVCRCNTSTKTSSDIYVDLDLEDKVSFYDIFSKIEVVPLETNEESLIGTINKLVHYDSNYYLLDTKQNCVWIFNEEGKIVKNIKSVGRGPEEYSYVYDFVINKYNHTIELLDCFGKLVIFNLDGTHKESIRLPHPPAAYHKLALLNQDTILFFTNSERENTNQLWVYSRSSNKMIKEFFDESHTAMSNMLPLYPWNDKVYFSLPLENTIYQIQNSQAIPAYTWDFGKYNYKLQSKDIPQDKKEKMKFYMAFGNSSQMSYAHILNLQNEQYLYCFLRHFGKNKHIFYDKKTKSSRLFGKTKEDISLNPYSMDQEMMIGIENFNSETYKQIIEANILDKKNQEQLSLITEDSNPIVVKYLFKR